MTDFSHFMQIWVFPPGLIIILAVLGILLRFYQKSWGKNLLIIAFVIFWMLSTPVVTQRLVDLLQNQFAPLQLRELYQVDRKSAVVILGAGIDHAREYKNKHVLSSMTFKRLHYAAHLYARTKLPIIVSGGNKDHSADTEASLMSETLNESYHIKTRALENRSRNTYEEALFLAPILAEQQITRIYLVTHAWHMPRSMYAFSKVFKEKNVQVIPAPTGYISLLSEEQLANYLPSIKALDASVYVLHELIGLAWYKAKS